VLDAKAERGEDDTGDDRDDYEVEHRDGVARLAEPSAPVSR
jgi:hypothetical protein